MKNYYYPYKKKNKTIYINCVGPEPVIPEEPEIPIQPEEPTEPEEPEIPIQPEEPTEPEQPEQPIILKEDDMVSEG